MDMASGIWIRPMMGMASIGRWSIETREPPALSRTLGGGLARIDSVAYGYHKSRRRRSRLRRRPAAGNS